MRSLTAFCKVRGSAARSSLRADVLQHDKGLGLDQPVGVGVADHRGFEHRGVGDQRLLDLERRHPDAADLEHVVAAAAIAVIAVGVAGVGVAGMGPLAAKGAARLVALVPIAVGGAGAAHDQLAGLAVGDVVAVIVEDAQLVARHRLAGAAVADVVRPVRQEDVQHLGRADAVEDVAAGLVAPALADMLGQRLAGRDAEAQPVGAGARAPARDARAAPRRASARRRRASGDAGASSSSTASGVGRSGSSTVEAPAAIGKVIELPSP